MLGMVPRQHVIAMMRLCAAIINPSLFEGWSSTVEEARALNTPMLLSDIAVHREQMGSNAEYFNPLNVEQLADKMKALRNSCQREQLPRRLSSDANARTRRFANDFLGVVSTARSLSRQRN
jgi:glycosyltransferase involved in cell wall biosynthesis